MKKLSLLLIIIFFSCDESENNDNNTNDKVELTCEIEGEVIHNDSLPYDDQIGQYFLNYESRNINHLPSCIVNLQKLQSLELSNNQLNSLPENIGDLHNLEVLELGGSQLETLPESIGNLQNLKRIVLKGNNFSEEEKAKIESWLPNTNINW